MQLFAEHAPLTAAGIHQQPQVQGRVGFLREELDGLGVAFVIQGEIVFGEIVNDLALFGPNGREQVDDLDVGRKARVLLRRGGRLAGLPGLLEHGGCAGVCPFKRRAAGNMDKAESRLRREILFCMSTSLTRDAADGGCVSGVMGPRHYRTELPARMPARMPTRE